MDTDALDIAGIGHNAPPDHGQIAAERMVEEYGEISKTVSALLAEAATMPKVVNDDATAGTLTKLIKRFRDTTAQLETFHTTEKEPYLRAGQAVDRYFFGLWEKCARRKKTDNPGAADILFARVDDYTQRKAAAEQRKRDEELRKAQDAERAATAKRLAEEEAARKADEAARRARKPENIETHQAAAADHSVAALDAKADETIARDRLQVATEQATAKPADLVRTRVSDDTVLTMAKEPFCDVIDVGLLDMATLWAFIDDDAKVKACKAWAKVTQYKRQMPGAQIGHRNKTVIR